MRQDKIGKFIARERKRNHFTQEELAEKLGISDRAVSKWERGLNLPDASLMLELASILNISVNELLSGEKIENDDYKLKAEEKLVELQSINNEYTRKLLYYEIIIGIFATLLFMISIFASRLIEMDMFIKIVFIVLGSGVFVFGIANCIKIEQIAGLYECEYCHYKYIPSYYHVLFSNHLGRMRKMKCPNCGKKSWHKKRMEK